MKRALVPWAAVWAGACVSFALWCGAAEGSADDVSPAPPTRVLVKVKAPLAGALEAAVPLDRLTLARDAAGVPEPVQGFLKRHSGRTLRPLYGSQVRAKRLHGEGERSHVEAVRRRFPRRAARAPRGVATPDLSRTYLLEVEVASSEELERVLAGLRADPAVEYAEQDRVRKVEFVPDDPYFHSSGTWGQSYDDLYGLKYLGNETAWDTTTGSGIVVAIVDTGIDYNHQDLDANVWTNAGEVLDGADTDGNGFIDDVRGWDFVDANYRAPVEDNDPMDGHGHGTHVAGTVAAEGNNGEGVVGVAFDARVMAVKGIDNGGYGLDSTLAAALRYAADNGADVINNSWGGEGSSATIADAVAYAYSLGAVVVTSSGNDNDDVHKYTPASDPLAIAVGASNEYDSRASFSNWGTKVDVVAPGDDILSLRGGGSNRGPLVGTDYMRLNGTSMAAPHVSGLSALILAANPAFSAEQVRQALRVSALDRGYSGFDLDYGHGRVDAAAALALTSVLESKMLSPASATHVAGPVVIDGVARGPGFQGYVLAYGSGDRPSSWTTLAAGSSPVDGGTLGTFDPSALADGRYTVRLTATDSSAQAFTDHIQLVVDYVTITAPAPPHVPSVAEVFKPGLTIPIEGTATGSSFLGFRLEWGRGINPTSGWTDVGVSAAGGGASPVTAGALGTWDTSGVTEADYYTIRLLVDNVGFTSEARTIVYLEPDLLAEGWPRWVEQVANRGGMVPAGNADGGKRLVMVTPYESASVPSKLRTFSVDGLTESTVTLTRGSYLPPAAANLDGSPGDEVIVAEAFQVRVFREDLTSTYLIPPVSANLQRALVVPEDLDGDGQLEVLAVGRRIPLPENDAYLFAWRLDGQQHTAAFPIAVADDNTGLRVSDVPRTLVVDLESDGVKEIVVAAGITTSSFRLDLYQSDGTPRAWSAPELNGYPGGLGAADLDHDGQYEVVVVVCGSPAQVHVLEPDGSERAGWPVTLDYYSPSYLAITDLDRDGSEEVLVSNYAVLHALTADGAVFSPAWPRTESVFDTLGPVATADVDGDGFPEVLVPRGDLKSSANPLVPTSVAGGMTEPPRLEAETVERGDWIESSFRITAYPGLTYQQPELLALNRDNVIVRSWKMLGAQGDQPHSGLIPTVADLDRDGLADVMASGNTIDGGDYQGGLEAGVARVLRTGAALDLGYPVWNAPYFDTRNTNVLLSSADLWLAKADAPDPLAAGETLVYTLTAGNAGPHRATGVMVVDTLPAGVGFVSASAGCAVAAETVTCTVPSLEVGGEAAFTITVTAPLVPGTLTNTAMVGGQQEDPAPENNAVSAVTDVEGPCIAPPRFDGLATVDPAAGPDCGVALAWAEATSDCGAGLRYSVYRSTSPGIVPDVTNRIATGLTGTSYEDRAGLAEGTYHYLVRAIDSSNALDDGNSVERSLELLGCDATLPDPVRAFTVTAHSTTNHLDWLDPVAGYGRTRVLFRADGSFPTGPDDADATLLGDFVGLPGAAGHASHEGLNPGTTYRYTAYVNQRSDGSGAFSDRRDSFGRPADSPAAVRWAYTTGASAFAPAGVVPDTAYYQVSNDRGVHAMSPGDAGGVWPAGWAPLSTNLPAEGRPLVITLRGGTTVMGVNRVGFVASQDGRVYAFDAESGEQLWVSEVLLGTLQGAVSAQFAGYGADFDLLVVGTREAGVDNAVFGLRMADGSVAWRFDAQLGIIASQVSLDTANNRAYFTSHVGDPPGHTVWRIDYTEDGVTGWQSVGLGAIDAPPILRAGSLFVGTLAGEIHQLDPVSLAPLWSYDSGAGPVTGLWVDTAGGRVFFSTGGTGAKVHGIAIGAASELWAPVDVDGASPPLLWQGSLYVGGAGSQLWQIPADTGADPTVLTLGGSSTTVGRGTVDVRTGLMMVGTGEGVVYAVAVPF